MHFLQSYSPPLQKSPLERQAEAAQLSAQFLSRYSYKPVPLDDTLSARVMDGFIKSLDPDRMLFLQADIDKFMAERSEIDDAIERKDLKIPFAIFNAYEQRVVDRMTYARSLLKQDFDFSGQDNYSVPREKAPGRSRAPGSSPGPGCRPSVRLPYCAAVWVVH